MSSSDSTPVARPQLTLRVGFAGARDLSKASPKVGPALEEVLTALGTRLVEIAPSRTVDCDPKPPSIATFYCDQTKPLLRLVSGLEEGADTLAHQSLDAVSGKPGDLATHLTTEHAGVLPFPFEDYQNSRSASHQPMFSKLADTCAWVLTLDGIYEKPKPDTPLASQRRARGYRAQSAFLLRQSDVLIAVADPGLRGSAGGTLESVRAASDFELPVVFIHAGTGEVYLIDPGEDLDMAISPACPTGVPWTETLRDWIDNIVADPDIESAYGTEAHQEFQTSLLEEFFGPERAEETKSTWHKRRWQAFEGRFRPDLPSPVSAPLPARYKQYRDRATTLNSHYTELYRSAYLLNFRAAVLAVLLAALSLVLLGQAEHSSPAAQVKALATAGQPATAPVDTEAATVPEASTETGTPGWLFPVLLVLGGCKLILVRRIFRTTHQANHDSWNDRAVDCRYLAERLRALSYLPLAGSFQPPAAAAPQYASRVTRQSAIDWLLDAIVRSISPADVLGKGSKIITLDPKATTELVRDYWIEGQIAYHDRNARTMGAIEEFAENRGKLLNLAVIGFVIADIIILILHLLHVLPEPWDTWTHIAAPVLVFFAAVLPAAVAGYNGIRFQSECQRLAERSAVMRTILRGRDDKTTLTTKPSRLQRLRHFVLTLFPRFRPAAEKLAKPHPGGRWKEANHLATCIAESQNTPDDPGAWTAESLRLTEKVANDFVQEVAEWSVLYAKEMPEP